LMRLWVIQNISAVSASCMAIRRDVFNAAGGFDSATFPNCYGDIDLCLRLRDQGLRTVWTPYAKVCQLDLPGRIEEFDNDRADGGETENLRVRWGHLLQNDPCYNPNLTLEREDFSLASPPRYQQPWKIG
jgi:hypothetical protein